MGGRTKVGVTNRLAKFCSGRVHYAWVVLGVMFVATLVGMGVRSAPGVIIVPLERAFGWSVGTISGAISLNILLLGLLGPFMAALIDGLGIKRTMVWSLALMAAGTGLSVFMTEPWQLYATWGLMVGIGSAAGAIGIATALVNRWFLRSRGLAIGLMMSASAAGQLLFLPILAQLSERFGWQSVALAVTLALTLVIPLMLVLLPETPSRVGLLALGATSAPPPQRAETANPVAIAMRGLVRGGRSLDFWLLAGSFSVCGFSANGLVGTHMIAYCVDKGISEVLGASLLASLGLFSLIGSTASGWLTDRFNPRVLLFWIYSLRGLSLLLLPFTQFDTFSLTAFAVFYGLDWVATGPPTFALTNEVFGEKDAPVVISWIFVGHQLGGALAALGAGSVRGLSGSYMMAFVASGLACLMAAMLVLRVTRRVPVLRPAE
ncbi:MAG: MFS transporter [Acetobacteraceae bacterium]|nr:MFS transporter [Acetobacteraceae bacterium]